MDTKFILSSRRFWALVFAIAAPAIELLRLFIPELPFPPEDQLSAILERLAEAVPAWAAGGGSLAAAVLAYMRHRVKPDNPDGTPAKLRIVPWKPRVPGPK